jgi:hypothetical protein
MIRRSLFWGLTLVLAAALVSLIVRGRRLEKEQAQQMVEVVRESKATPTRVFAPQDLQIVQARMQLEKDPGGKGRIRTAQHEIEIRNNGSVPYSDIQLEFDYVSHTGKELATRMHLIPQRILPGATLSTTDILVTEIPASTADSKAVIISANLAK